MRRVVAFFIAAGAIVWCALPDGSYDIVVRQEEVLAVWWVLGLGAALGLLPRAKLRRETVWALIPLAALFLWTAAALLWTTSDERTLGEVVRVAGYAGVVLLVWSLASPTTWRAAAGGVTTGALTVCGLALASRLAPDLITDKVAAAFDPKRLSYPLGYWNAVAAWGAMCAAMALVWSAHARSSIVRAVSLAAVPLAVVVVYLTYSRAGAAGVGLACVAALVLSVNRWTLAIHALAAAGSSALAIAVVRSHPDIANGSGSKGAAAVLLALGGGALLGAVFTVLTRAGATDGWRVPSRVAGPAVVGVLLVCIVASGTLGREPVSEAWEEFRQGGVVASPTTRGPDPSARLGSLEGTRYEVWSSAVRALRAEPFQGTGPGTFEFHWSDEGGREFLRDAHSLYLEQAAELGFPGAGLTIAALLALGVLGVRARVRLRDPSRAGAAAAMSAGFVVFLFHAGVDWMWETTAVTVLALVAVALAAGSIQRPARTSSPALRIGLPILAVGVCALALPGLLSTGKIRASRDAFREGNVETARSHAAAAVRRQPWAASPYVQRALVRWADGDLRGAGRDLKEARRKESLNWRHPLLLARLEAERGRPRAAILAFRDARRLRPGSPFVAPPPGALRER